MVSALGLPDYGSSKPEGSRSQKSSTAKGFTCQWADCSAAQRQIQTYAGKKSCYCCLRPKAQAVQPPLESMTKWAFEAKLAAAKPKAKAKAKPKPKPAARNAEGDEPAQQDLVELRQQRLEALRDAAESKPPKQHEAATKDGGPTPANASRQPASGDPPRKLLAEVEAAFNAAPSTDEEKKKVKLEDALIEEITALSKKGIEVVNSLHAEYFPTQADLPTAEKILQWLLSNSQPFVNDDGRAKAEAAVKLGDCRVRECGHRRARSDDGASASETCQGRSSPGDEARTIGWRPDKRAGLWLIDTANPNSWTTAAKRIVNRSASDVTLL